jgi:hypothetical protein
LCKLAAALFLAGTSAPALADGIIEDPLPRVEDRLCPGIVGLETGMAETLVSRIRANAASFGVPLADTQTCEANLVVAIVDDGQAWLTDLAGRRGYLFRDMDRVDREELLAATGPVRVWNQVTVRTRDGMRVGLRENLTNLPQAGMWSAHSRIYRPVRKDITYTLVLFDKAAAGTLTPAQLADYATLRALATEFPDNPGASSILALFDAGDRPAGLTDHDRAWLGELYRGIPNVPASVRLNSVEEPAG